MPGNEPFKVPESIFADWQNLANTLAELLDVPAALIMRLDQDELEVFVTSESEGNPYPAGKKEQVWGSGLYCEHVLATQDKLLVPNALADEKWKDNPDIPLGMISYLGYPIALPDETLFGTLCVLDRKENSYDPVYERLMAQLRNLIESHLALLHMNHCLGEESRTLADFTSEIQDLRGLIPICASCKSIRDDEGYWHRVEDYVSKQPGARFSHGLCPDCAHRLYPDAKLGNDAARPGGS